MAKKRTFEELWAIDPSDISPPKKKPSFSEMDKKFRLVEPGESAEPPPKSKPWVEPETIQKYVTKPAKKGLGAGLGAIGWPFERASALVGTVLRETGKERIETARRHKVGEVIPIEEQIWGIAKSIGRGVVPPAKSMVLRKLHPEAVTIMDIVREDVLPNSPAWVQFSTGLAAEFAVTPAIVSGAFKALASGAKLTGIPQKIVAKGLPEWQRMKLRARMKTGVRIEKAQEATKSLQGKQVKQIAQELSKRTSKPVSKAAVEQRLGQIIKGGITEQSSLQKASAPAIKEIASLSKEAKALGILPEQTYITKLTRKQISDLLAKKVGLEKRLAGIYRAPYKHTLLNAADKLKIQGKNALAERLIKLGIKIEKSNPELGIRLGRVLDVKTTQPTKLLNILEKIEKASLKERTAIINKLESLAVSAEKQRVVGLSPLTKKISSMKRTFPGQTKLAKNIQDKIDDITSRIQQSYKLGGTKYMPRMYTSKELERAQRTFPAYSEHRIRAPYANQRQKIPFEVRKQMGEITRPAYPVTKRLIQEGADVETAKLFNQVVQRTDWSSKLVRPGFKRLPDTKGYGALKNMYVHPKIYNDVTALVETKNKFWQIIDSGIGTWKLGKVVLSPSTHFRNKFSNKILLDLSGMGFAEQAKYAARALKEWSAKSKEYQVAKRYFARTTMVKGELMDDILKTTSQDKGFISNVINGFRKGTKKVLEKPSELYQHEEFVNKFMKYLQQRDLGKSVIESVEEANKWLFDYGELSKWEKTVARRIMPFYTFPRKALPRVAEAMVKRPYTVAKYPLMAQLTTQYSLGKLELTDKDYDDIKKTLPEYMKSGSYILMPYRDTNGDLRFLDWTYIVPWGEIAEAGQRGALRSVVTNPIINMVGDIMRNKTSFTQREIWNETDTFEEKTWKKTQYVWQNLMPSLTPKGLYWDKLKEAATGKPLISGKKRPLPETVAHTIFGLRTQPIDIKRQRKYDYYDMQEKTKELSGKLNRLSQELKAGRIKKDEFIKKRAQYRKQLRELQE